MPQTRARSATLACLIIAAAAPAPAAPTPNSPGQPAQTAAPAKQPLMRFTFTDGSALTARLLASGPEGYLVRGLRGTTPLPADRLSQQSVCILHESLPLTLLGCGAHVLVAWQVPQVEQRLRDAACQQ